jgi:hypothetical protein
MVYASVIGRQWDFRPIREVFYCRSHDAVMRVYVGAGNVIETHEHKGDFKEW